MTREEAINVLNDYDINFERHTPKEVAEAHEMAIKALQTQPSERTEERTETHEGDCISRKAVLDALHRYSTDGFDGDKWWNSTVVLYAINEVPSINGGTRMNELTKIKQRILERIEMYIGDIELAEEKELMEDEKTILESVKDIINEEFGKPALNRVKEQQRCYENIIHFADAICRLSQTCGISYSEAKDVIEESIEILKKLQTGTAKWVEAGIGIDCTGHRFKEYKCSNCGNIDLSHRKNKFCPECGRRIIE